jgi:hypothetical protein
MSDELITHHKSAVRLSGRLKEQVTTTDGRDQRHRARSITDIVDKIGRSSQAGQAVAIQVIMDRIFPRDRTVQFDLPIAAPSGTSRPRLTKSCEASPAVRLRQNARKRRF